MNEVTTIGVDLAKTVFQVHGIDALGQVVVRRQLRRSQVLPFFEKQASCVVGIEACATSHHWAREIAKLGHDVRLMPARYVKLSFPKSPSGLDSHRKAESSHPCERCLGSCTRSECSSPPCSSRGAGLRPRIYFSAIS